MVITHEGTVVAQLTVNMQLANCNVHALLQNFDLLRKTGLVGLSLGGFETDSDGDPKAVDVEERLPVSLATLGMLACELRDWGYELKIDDLSAALKAYFRKASCCMTRPSRVFRPAARKAANGGQVGQEGHPKRPRAGARAAETKV